MNIYTFKARSLAEAMQMVRTELGPDASVLHTRVIGSPMLGLLGSQTLEVTASDEVDVPSRLPPPEEASHRQTMPGAELNDYRRQMRKSLLTTIANETSLVEQLSQDQKWRAGDRAPLRSSGRLPVAFHPQNSAAPVAECLQ